MTHIARSCRVAVAGLAVSVVGVLGLAGGTASAEPVIPPRPNPAPAPAPPAMPQTATVAPGPVTNTIPGTAPSAAPLPVSSALTPARPAAPSVVSPSVVSPSVVSPPVPPALLPASSGTLRDYFQGKNVNLEAQRPQGFRALDITLPMPPGWTQVPDPNVPDAFVVTANRSSNSLYTSNAQVVVYRLGGNFDPKEAITHGYVDSQQLPAWRSTDASLANFGGLPSSIIEGTYRQNDMTLNTSRRYVIATSGPDQYLVSLVVTTDATQAVAEAPATDAIVNGFRVGAPAPAQAAARPAGVPGVPTAQPSQTVPSLAVAPPH